MDRQAKTEAFRALHRQPQPLLMPNPWDSGSARLMVNLGFSALGTTSLGVALSAGVARADKAMLLANARAIVEATDLPVSLDFEDLFAHHPAAIATSVAEAYATGVIGFSIEDTSRPGGPVMALDVAVERVAAAVAANARLPVPMVVTARSEWLFNDPSAVDAAIDRVRAYESAGADVLYVPYVRDLATMARVVEAVSQPVNVVMGFADPAITLEQLAGIGVARISVGGALARLAMQACQDAARQMRAGGFDFVTDLKPLSNLISAAATGESR